MAYLLVGLGGGIGAISRFWLGRQIAQQSPSHFPLGTLLINVSGSLIIGLILGWMLEQSDTGGSWRWLIVVGILGGYTTFSTFAFESIALLDKGEIGKAVGYIVISNAASLAVCGLGLWIARTLAN